MFELCRLHPHTFETSSSRAVKSAHNFSALEVGGRCPTPKAVPQMDCVFLSLQTYSHCYLCSGPLCPDSLSVPAHPLSPTVGVTMYRSLS